MCVAVLVINALMCANNSYQTAFVEAIAYYSTFLVIGRWMWMSVVLAACSSYLKTRKKWSD
jgi:hypothetical protein